MERLEAAKRTLSLFCKPGSTLLCAVSGGLDSMCLLHLAVSWGTGEGYTVLAAHFNHQLRGENADRDEQFVRDYCEARNLPFLCGRGDTRALAEADRLSIEEAARRLRYRYLEDTALGVRADWILTAHHADDNAETMLLNLCRGTGLRGLTGIPTVRENICRPFRDIPRAELLQYAAENGIPHVEDETNDGDEAARNLIRHYVLPVLKEINPRAVDNMARTALTLESENKAMDQLARRLTQEVKSSPQRVTLPIKAFSGTPPAIRERAVLQVLQRVPELAGKVANAHVASVAALLCRRSRNSQVSLPGGWIARLDGDALVIEPSLRLPAMLPMHEEMAVRFGDWEITLSDGPKDGLSYRVAWDRCQGEDDPACITAWRSEDRMTLPGSRGARSVKRLCVDHGISAAQREGLPVLRFGDRPAAIPGIGVEEGFSPDHAKMSITITFQYRGEQ